MRARVFLGFLTLLAPLLAAGAALAQPAQPLDRLLPQIRRNVPGQFLDAEGANRDGNPHYHLKWLTPDGRVMWLDADARTGRVLGQSPGRDGFDAPRLRPPEGDNGGPSDRGAEGRSFPQRYDTQGERPETRRQYRGDTDGGPRAAAPRPERNFGSRFERTPFGGGEGRFGGQGFGNRGDRGQGNDRGRGFGGRDRGGRGNGQ